MKVIELINKLKNLDPHLEVFTVKPVYDDVFEKTGIPGRKLVSTSQVILEDEKVIVK